MTQVSDQSRGTSRWAAGTQRALRITVLCGGPSAEREVSLVSGRAVADALRRRGHQVHVTDIFPDDLSALDRPVDVVFPALHGTFGEDGAVQAIMEARGIRYCGSDAAASALAMDKPAAKRAVGAAGVPTPRFDVVDDGTRAEIAAAWQAPVVLKPVAEGSSVGVTIVRRTAEIAAALDAMLERYGQALIEAYVPGPELTVGVLGDEALPVVQIVTAREFYDYQAKYEDDGTEYRFDIDLPDELLREVQRLSLEAHRALGCRDFSRVDWMVDAASGRPYFLETNTIPGFTGHSLLPKAAARAGRGFDGLVERIVELTLERS